MGKIENWVNSSKWYLISFSLLANLNLNAENIAVGNILVEKVGTGLAPLDSSSTAIQIIEYSKSGDKIQSIQLPYVGTNQITDSGFSYTHGQFNSYNGLIAIPGYDSPIGTGSVAISNTKQTILMNNTGLVLNTVRYPTDTMSPLSGGSLRSVIPTSPNTFYLSGNSSSNYEDKKGIWYFNGSSFNQLASITSRNIEIFNNQLYCATVAGIVKVGQGLPTSGTQDFQYIINTSSTFYGTSGFVLFDTDGNSVPDTAFLADERDTTGGGLQKWTSIDGLNWLNVYSLLISPTTEGAGTFSTETFDGYAGIRGLTGSFDPDAGFSLFATTGSSNETHNNRLISIFDDGNNLPTTFKVVELAGENFAFRGVDVMSIPEPSALSLLAVGLGGLLMLRRGRA